MYVRLSRNVYRTNALALSNKLKSSIIVPCSLNHDDVSGDRTIKVSSSGKYKIFQDKDSPVIFDIEEERKRFEIEKQEVDTSDEFTGINMKRGLHGVFDIEDLVEVIRRDKGQDICVIALPASLKYVDHMCIVTCRSARHMLALAEFIRKLYKRKRSHTDVIPKIEGADSKEWMAMDLGNIALHIFAKQARIKYDIDMLWSVGPEYDTETNKPDDSIVELLEKHSIFLENLKPKE